MMSIEYFTLFCFCKNLFYVWKYLSFCIFGKWFGSDLKIITFWKIQRKSKMGCLYKSRYTFLFLISSCDFIIGCSYHTSVRTSTKEGLRWKNLTSSRNYKIFQPLTIHSSQVITIHRDIWWAFSHNYRYWMHFWLVMGHLVTQVKSSYIVVR